MGQFGLLVIPALVVLNLLSPSTTPMESIPEWRQHEMQVMPTPHFVSAQAVLHRAAGFEIVWRQSWPPSSALQPCFLACR